MREKKSVSRSSESCRVLRGNGGNVSNSLRSGRSKGRCRVEADGYASRYKKQGADRRLLSGYEIPIRVVPRKY